MTDKNVTTVSNIYNFVVAGNSTFTLYSKKLDKRYTYNVKVDKKNNNNDTKRFYAKVLYGEDNTKDYRYIGLFYHDNLTLKGNDSSKSDTRFLMLEYFLRYLCLYDELPDGCLFYPSGLCCRCGRKLTTPESIERGIGPKCQWRN